MPVHLTPIEQPAADVLLTGDPRRAFAIAGELMEQPRMSHQARGLWGYTGTTAGGLDLTVQSTGTGGPSAAAVFGDLTGLGARSFVRLGTCVVSPGGPAPGTALLVKAAICQDGTSGALAGAGETVLPDPALFELFEGIAEPVAVSSHDFVARTDPSGGAPATGAVARDLQTATILALAAKTGLGAAAVLIVASETAGVSMAEAELTERFLDLGRSVSRRLETTR